MTYTDLKTNIRVANKLKTLLQFMCFDAIRHMKKKAAKLKQLCFKVLLYF